MITQSNEDNKSYELPNSASYLYERNCKSESQLGHQSAARTKSNSVVKNMCFPHANQISLQTLLVEKYSFNSLYGY